MTLVSDSEGQVFFSFAAWLEDALWESCSTQPREQVWVQGSNMDEELHRHLFVPWLQPCRFLSTGELDIHSHNSATPCKVILTGQCVCQDRVTG